MSAGEGWPEVHLVHLWLCDACLDGEGGECHTPGCAMWINRAPDLSLRKWLTDAEGHLLEIWEDA